MPRFSPETVSSPVAERRTIIVPVGGSLTSPLATLRAIASASIASESRGEFRNANPISA